MAKQGVMTWLRTAEESREAPFVAIKMFSEEVLDVEGAEDQWLVRQLDPTSTDVPSPLLASAGPNMLSEFETRYLIGDADPDGRPETPVPTGAHASITAGFRAAYRSFRDVGGPSRRRILLVTDGNLSGETYGWSQRFRSEGIHVDVVLVGRAYSSFPTSQLAADTGGTFKHAPMDEDIVPGIFETLPLRNGQDLAFSFRSPRRVVVDQGGGGDIPTPDYHYQEFVVEQGASRLTFVTSLPEGLTAMRYQNSTLPDPPDVPGGSGSDPPFVEEPDDGPIVDPAWAPVFLVTAPGSPEDVLEPTWATDLAATLSIENPAAGVWRIANDGPRPWPMTAYVDSALPKCYVTTDHLMFCAVDCAFCCTKSGFHEQPTPICWGNVVAPRVAKPVIASS